jgi:hypothetical protein
MKSCFSLFVFAELSFILMNPNPFILTNPNPYAISVFIRRYIVIPTSIATSYTIIITVVIIMVITTITDSEVYSSMTTNGDMKSSVAKTEILGVGGCCCKKHSKEHKRCEH